MDFDMTKLKTGHGSPEDRGGADYWYHRPRKPHWYPNGTYNDPEILEPDMTQAQIDAYHKGYDEAEKAGLQKDFG